MSRTYGNGCRYTDAYTGDISGRDGHAYAKTDGSVGAYGYSAADEHTD